MKSILRVPNFSKEVPRLRKHFDQVFRDPRISDSRRFQFDFWHVENQYTLHRTLARTFFPKSEMNLLILALQKFGQENFGCYSISEPWLSFYTEGCRQELHTDDPHGPWAYVLSLTPKKRKFRGGETMIYRGDNAVSRFRTGSEFLDLFELIEPNFNQLVVFNPRSPHGVREVNGTFDPREARLVIHGWFVEPKPYVTGGLRNRKIDDVLQYFVGEVSALMPQDLFVEGISTLALDVSRSGTIKDARFLTQNLATAHSEQIQLFLNLIRKLSFELNFPKCSAASRIVLPLVFS